MKQNLKIAILILAVMLLVGCEPSVEGGLTYDEYVKRASQYRNDNDYDRAIAAGKKAAGIKPNDGETHYFLATLYDEAYRRSFDNAQMKYLEEVILNPDKRRNQDPMEEYKKYGLKMELRALALQEFRETLKYSPNNWGARYYIATDYFNNKQFREAIDEYKKVIEINPNYVNSYSLMGEAYYELGEYASAIQSLQKAVKIDDTDAYAYYNLGRVYRKIDNWIKLAEVKNKLKGMNSPFYDTLR